MSIIASIINGIGGMAEWPKTNAVIQWDEVKNNAARKHKTIYIRGRLKIPTAFAVGQRKRVLLTRVYGKFKCSSV
jgi:hypothetical protein